MPIDIGKHVAYWRTGATEDIETARLLLEHDRSRAALFFAHLAPEKALKALVVKAAGDLAPLTHNLVVLAKKTSLEFQESVRVYFVEMNRFSLHGRYPDPDRPLPSLLYSRTRVPRPMRPLTLSLSPSEGEGIESVPSPSSIKRVGVRVAYVFTHNPG